MKFKNSQTMRVIVALLLMFVLYSCENHNSPTDTNQLQETDLSTSNIQSLSVGKSNHDPNELAAQSSGVTVEITGLAPYNGQVLNVPPGSSTINASWSASATFTLPPLTFPVWSRLEVWIDGQMVKDTGKQIGNPPLSVSGTKNLGIGSHTIKAKASHVFATFPEDTELKDESQQTNNFTVVDPTPPPPAPNVTATTQSGHPKLTWGAVSGAVRYQLTKAKDNNPPITWTQTSTTYIDWSENAIPTNLGNLMYKVQSVNSEGQAGNPAVKLYTTF